MKVRIRCIRCEHRAVFLESGICHRDECGRANPAENYTPGFEEDCKDYTPHKPEPITWTALGSDVLDGSIRKVLVARIIRRGLWNLAIYLRPTGGLDQTERESLSLEEAKAWVESYVELWFRHAMDRTL